MRLNQFLARAGVASRRGADELIRLGQVTVNGALIVEPGMQVEPHRDAVKVRGRRVHAEVLRYYLFHKPAGMVSTLSDPKGRPSLGDLASRLPGRVVPVGRLDYHSEGLVLLTNDGDLVQRLLHPRFGVPRTYQAKVKGVLGEEKFRRLREGVSLPDGRARAEVFPVRKLEANSVVRVTVREGRPHLVRRLLAAVGHPVLRLTRTAFGPLELGSLPKGAWRPLEDREVRALRALTSSGTSLLESRRLDQTRRSEKRRFV